MKLIVIRADEYGFFPRKITDRKFNSVVSQMKVVHALAVYLQSVYVS